MLDIKHYKSWSGLNKQLTKNLCNELQGRITYFLTYYRKVHNSYGRASIRLDGKELVNFSWLEMLKQDSDYNDLFEKRGQIDYNDDSIMPEEICLNNDDEQNLMKKWNEEATLSDHDFLEAATNYLQLSIKDALESDNYIIKVFAIMDKRVGKRTLKKINDKEEYKNYPKWVQQFYKLRLKKEKYYDFFKI